MRIDLALAICLVAQGGCTFLFAADEEGPEAIDAGDAVADAALVADARLEQTNLCLDGAPNNILDGEEECDDGNMTSTDACTNLCRFARCGDGIVRSFIESCDETSPTCQSCVTCDDLETSNHVAQVDGRCYIVNIAPVSWAMARETCMSVYGGELAALDGAPNPNTQSETIRQALLNSPVAAIEELPDEFWLGMHLHTSWRWLGSNTSVGPHWTANSTPSEMSYRPSATLQTPYEWVGTNLSTSLASLCMRTALPNANPTSRLGVSEETNHIYVQQIATLRTSAGVGTFAEHRAACEARGARLASFEVTGEADVARMIVSSGAGSYVGAERVGSTADFVWSESGLPVDASLWAIGHPTLSTDQCVVMTSAGKLQEEGCALVGQYAICEWD